jgi:hypothetical protein
MLKIKIKSLPLKITYQLLNKNNQNFETLLMLIKCETRIFSIHKMQQSEKAIYLRRVQKHDFL